MANTPEHYEIIYGDHIPGTELRHTELFQRYCDSEFGAYHAEQPPRYSVRYGYDPAAMLADLGDDIHPVRHGSYTEASIVRPFLAAQNRSGEERFDVKGIVNQRITGHLHDLGECQHPKLRLRLGYTVGDIPWGLKTAADSYSERAIRGLFYKLLYPDVPPDILDGVDDTADNDEGSLSREGFSAVEKLGYYTTGLQAGKVALELQTNRTDADELRFIQLSRLAIAVTSNHRETLRAQSTRFPYITVVLERSERLDERIHASLHEF